MRALLRGHAATVLVAALAAAFGVALLGAIQILTIALAAAIGPLGSMAIVLDIMALVFVAITIYVAAIVTTNTVATIVAGRIREIALVRLLGASARSQRIRIAREGLAAGGLGALIGTAAACALLAAFVLIGEASALLRAATYAFLVPAMALPVVAVVLTTWLAAWLGSRRVLVVTPVEALGAAVPAEPAARSRRGRAAAAWILVGGGALLLALGALVGQSTPFGVLIGIVGGILSFTGVMVGSVLFVPPLLALVGRAFGRGPAATLGVRNALRYPERSARAAIGLVIGVGLVTMFTVAGLTANEITRQRAAVEFGESAGMDGVFAMLLGILAVLVGFSAVIAAVGFVNTLTAGVLQRTREFGLVRALGLAARQLRATISIEAAQLAATAIVSGFLLGVAYGWAGAQALFGAVQVAGLVPPVVPWWLAAALVGAAALLALVGSLVPARRALRIVPVEALAAE